MRLRMLMRQHYSRKVIDHVQCGLLYMFINGTQTSSGGVLRAIRLANQITQVQAQYFTF